MLNRLLPALALALTAVAVPAVQATPAAASPPGDKDVIANLFEWNWPSVAAECTNVLGPQGYGAVQVAPPEDSLTRDGHPWWEVYQPGDYDVNSRMGTRQQFTSMVQACHAAGVKVYADAVINHMTGQGSTTYGGRSFSKYSYPGIYSSADFHDYPADCPESDDQIHNWNDFTEVTKCELSSLSDLRTETDHVRSEIAGYLDDLLGLGVDGFRVDAAKHIGSPDLKAIESRLTRSAYIYQEVMPGGSGDLAPGAFEGSGDLLEFVYGQKLKEQFNGSIANLQSFGRSWGFEPSDKAVVFVANHDTERNGSTLSYKDGAKYRLATIFSLAWGYGTPQVYSGFDFNGTDDSPPADSSGHVSGTNCSSGWQGCLDRTLGGMVGWHNAVKGTSVTNWWSDGSNEIAFGRGAKGYVAINNSGSTLSRTFATGLPAGTYCDVVGGGVSGGTCTGTAVTVDGSGNATFQVAPGSAVAIDVAATGQGGGTGSIRVTFNETATTTWGQNVFVVGSIPALGNWAPANAVALSSASYPVWSATVTLPTATTFQYKYLKKNTDGSVTWESDPNRTYTTGTGTTATVNDTWR
ncbi:carbohydrate-binding module family 20 domain-containing protein [Actinoallomurus iriomotensis]|uniref:Alpha-amylase n=1 Tax=Actinoallomurus iriomotensis TaxID=478107 RepID=A0A9W6VT71_9ACTN|nr:carbohydrate-binding module family 20 domain-containing protein [Actinoallomurus iriomotensis]GLY79430.1 alpha-amylase [Actinoallomurus iriomotensis]